MVQQWNSRENIGRRDENTLQHLWRHVHPISLSLELFPLRVVRNNSTQSRPMDDLCGRNSRPSSCQAEISNLEGTRCGNEDIGGLDIKVNHSRRVNMVDSLPISLVLCQCPLDSRLTVLGQSSIPYPHPNARRLDRIPPRRKPDFQGIVQSE